jgi:hypothetical protein
MKGRVVFFERKVEIMQKEFSDYSKSVNTRLWNICSAKLDPAGTKDAKWKSYWQEQMAILSKPTVYAMRMS